jgi:small conductance mechanosensitive channel
MLGTVFLALVYAAVLLGAGFLVGGWLAGVARFTLDRTRLDPEVRYLVVLAIRPVVIVLAVIAALESLGVALDGVVIVLGAAALSVGLAMRETLSNAAAGALLLSHRPWRLGDEVEAAGERGTVVETTLFTTTLKTPGGVVVTLANRLVLDAPMRNHGKAAEPGPS